MKLCPLILFWWLLLIIDLWKTKYCRCADDVSFEWKRKTDTMNLVKRKFFRVGKYLVACALVYLVSWIVSVTEWSGPAAPWGGGASRPEPYSPYENTMSTMKTIVAYSEGKQAEMDRPAPVTCDELPHFPNVTYINRTWTRGEEYDSDATWQKVPGTDVSLYAAYYDRRKRGQPYVRILARFRGRKWGDRPQLFCQTRPRSPTEMTVEVVAAKVLEIWRYEWDTDSQSIETPLLLSCSLTGELQEVSIISVVQQPCFDPENAFVLNPFEYKELYERNFTVCVKDMKFKGNKSQRIIEWIEANKILGAEMIDIYVDTVCEETEHVLEYYRSKGTVRLFQVPINHNHRSLWQRRRDHIISYNDCLYRNIKESKFILPIDIDEVILPKVAHSWQDLISRLERLGYDSTLHSAIVIRNVFFFDFIQSEDSNTFENKSTIQRKLYTKRDDVRLESRMYEFNKISTNLGAYDVQNDIRVIKTVIDSKETDNLLEKCKIMYKSRCDKEMPISTILSHKLRSSMVSPVGHFMKSIMLTRKVLTAFNHYPLLSIGSAVFGGWPAPFEEVQMNHYKAECNSTLVPCEQYTQGAQVDLFAMRLRDKLLLALCAAPCANHFNTSSLHRHSINL